MSSTTAPGIRDKVKALKEMVDEYTRDHVALAFSGGVDSSLLLKMCCDAAAVWGNKVYAITAQTWLHPSGDPEIAERVCREMGAESILLKIDELEEAGIMDNPVDRCYLCKHHLFSRILEVASELNIPHVLEGTNEDDLHVYRPGIRALDELGIISPLARCGITKKEVRILASEYGISVADRPSTPCMATRFPYGTRLDKAMLRRVEVGEKWLTGKGFYNVRLRVHGDILRIEVDDSDLEKALAMRKEIIARMQELGYGYITLDLMGFRSGSMDRKITEEFRPGKIQS